MKNRSTMLKPALSLRIKWDYNFVRPFINCTDANDSWKLDVDILVVKFVMA